MITFLIVHALIDLLIRFYFYLFLLIFTFKVLKICLINFNNGMNKEMEVSFNLKYFAVSKNIFLMPYHY